MSILRMTWQAALACACSACVDLPQLPAPSAPSTPADAGAAPSPAAALRLGGWNLRKFGLEADKDLPAIARIIDAHFDLLAVLELMWTERGPPLAELLDQLGPEWSAHVTSSARPDFPTPQAEYYAVLYRPARIAPCRELPELRYVDDGDGGEEGLFLREPAFGCYRAAPLLGARDFWLGVYHARWGSGEPAEIAREVRHLDAAVRAFAASLPNERELFVIGDFNLTPGQLVAVTGARDRTRGQGSTLDASGALSAHLYDHLLAFGAPADAALAQDARVLDVRSEANDPAHFRAHVSDHLPIVASLPPSPDDD